MAAGRSPRFSTNAWRSCFAFLDETGTLHSPRDRFFAVGMVKCPDPSAVQRPIQALREREHFYAEFKWSAVRRNSLPAYQRLVDCFFAYAPARFGCFIADKQVADPIRTFGNQWQAYERLACQLLVGNIGPAEHVVVLADEYSTPPQVTFEANVRDCVNARLHQKHVIGVCRMRSTGVDLFQVLDVLLGAVAYEYKCCAGLLPGGGSPPKMELLHYIRARAGVPTFVGGVRNAQFNVAEKL